MGKSGILPRTDLPLSLTQPVCAVRLWRICCLGELLINALSGAASLEVLRAVGEEHLNGKTLIDVSNPIDISRGFPLTLFVKDTDSPGEMLQRAFPNLRVVRTLNNMTAALMVNPRLVGNGDHTVSGPG